MHKVSYEILNKHDRPDSMREIDVDATESELASLQRDGYLLREQLFTGAALERLRTGVDRLVEKEWDQHRNKEIGERSWGIILRYLMDKDPVFLELLKFPPILSVAKAMLGPLIRLRGLSARVTFPGA